MGEDPARVSLGLERVQQLAMATLKVVALKLQVRYAGLHYTFITYLTISRRVSIEGGRRGI